MPPRLRNIGMVFQSYAVWPHMTVRQNVSYPLRHRRFRRTEISRKVDQVLDLVGLSEFAERSVVALSGGQMQRVALARSLVYSPQLLLLDEPLSTLDAKLRLRLRDDLRRIIKDAGVTAVYVTHDQAEAVVLGDRIGVMRDGKMLQIAPPTDIYNRPADLFVANFTGASDLLAGRVLERSGEFGTVEVSSGDRLSVWLPPSVRRGENVRVAVRPENVRLGPFPNGEPNRFSARVLASTTMALRQFTNLQSWAGGSTRLSSAPARETSLEPTLTSSSLRRCAGATRATNARRGLRSAGKHPESSTKAVGASWA